MKMLAKLFKPKKLKQTGDTIVEVLISMTILSLALAGAYSLGSLSLRNATDTNNRTEALALAQGQVDFLAGLKTNDKNFATDYELGVPYCINADTTANKTVGSDNLCDGYQSSPYNVGISFGSSSQVFTITAQWPSPHAPNGTANLNLYYKLPGSYQPASVNTTTASSVGDTSVTLNGTVDPGGISVSGCYFNFGQTTSYGAQVNCSSLPSGSGSQPVSASKTGLSANTTYHFELCVTNSAGVDCDSDQSFTTTNTVPIVAMTHMDEYYNNGRGNGQLDLSGTVNDQNVSGTTAWFEESCDNSDWSSCNGGAFPTTKQSVPTNNSSNGISQTVFPWTFYYYGFHNDYYFRICAQNGGGKTCSAGADLSNATKVWP